MVPIGRAVYFSDVRNLFDENDKIKDDSYHKLAQGLLKELIWYAKKLKAAGK